MEDYMDKETKTYMDGPRCKKGKTIAKLHIVRDCNDSDG